MNKTLNVCCTMDVERIRSESPTGGPPSWEFGEAAVRDYCDFLDARGYPATLFVVPDTMEKQAALFQEMAAAGHECGMHFHPQSWRDHYRNAAAYDYLGGYSGEEQHSFLRQALEQYGDAFGSAPELFRPGNFSASDATFQTLEALGFRGGSVSQPNRCVPSVKAVWTGTDRTVHRAHRAFRLIAGDLEFVEVPVTVDVARTDHWTGVGDTRFEDCDVPGIRKAVEQELQWQKKEGAVVFHVCFFTHNFVCYGVTDRDGVQSRKPVLEGALEAIAEVASSHGMTPVGCTISGLRERYLEATT